MRRASGHDLHTKRRRATRSGQSRSHIRALEAAEGRPRVRIKALTANGMDEDHRRCLDAGMDDSLTKPVTKAAVLRALAAARPILDP